MARAIKQYRYYAENDSRNYPAQSAGTEKCASFTNLCNGNLFKNNQVYPILALGIQTLPGTKFYLNGSEDPIVVGATGIYELDVVDKAEIVNMLFDPTSLLAIRDSANGYLLIDILYEDIT